MKLSTNMHSNSKLLTNPKEKSRGSDLYHNRNDLDSKLFSNVTSTLTQHQFASFGEGATVEYNRQHTSTSTPKMSNSASAQFNLSASATKNSINSDSKKNFLVSELKTDTSASKSQSDLNKRLYFNKVNSETTSNSTKKIDTSLGARRSNAQPKTESRGTSRDDKFNPESPANSHSRKDRFFGSYDHTPTNSEHKRVPMRTEMSSSGKKAQDFDLRELLTSKKMTTSPSKKAAAQQDIPYSQKDSSYNANRNLFLNQKAPNVTNNRVERGKNANVLFNNLLSPSSKSNHRSFTKDHTRSFHESDNSRHNNSNDSIHLTAKTPSSILGSKGQRTPTNDASKLYPFSNYSAGGAASRNLNSSKESKGTTSFTSLYKEKRSNYQEILRGKREEYEKYANQSTANQTKSSTANTNSLEGSERFFNGKSSNLAAEIYSRLTQSTKSTSGFRSMDVPKQREERSIERCKYNAGNILSEDTSLISPQKQSSGKSITEIQSRSELEDCNQMLISQLSQLSSKDGSRSHSAVQNIQEIIEFEKKKHEALKTRISLNFEAFKANKANRESANRLGGQIKSNKSFESQPELHFVHDTSFPKTTKNSAVSQNFEFAPKQDDKHDTMIDNFTLQIISDSFGVLDNERSPAFGQNDLFAGAGADGQKQQNNGSETEIGAQKDQVEFIETPNLTPKNIAFIEYEEIPMNEHERRLNSREKRNTYKLESDRTEGPATERRHTPRTIGKSTSPELNSLISASHPQGQVHKTTREEDKETIQHLLKLVTRLKGVLEEDRNREKVWKNEKSQMQAHIEELQLRLAKYE